MQWIEDVFSERVSVTRRVFGLTFEINSPGYRNASPLPQALSEVCYSGWRVTVNKLVASFMRSRRISQASLLQDLLLRNWSGAIGPRVVGKWMGRCDHFDFKTWWLWINFDFVQITWFKTSFEIKVVAPRSSNYFKNIANANIPFRSRDSRRRSRSRSVRFNMWYWYNPHRCLLSVRTTSRSTVIQFWGWGIWMNRFVLVISIQV